MVKELKYCSHCNNRLVELTEDKDKKHLSNDNDLCTGYECSIENLEFHQYGIKIQGGGCGELYDART